MKILALVFNFLLIVMLSTAAAGDIDSKMVTRYYANTCDSSGLNTGISLRGTPGQTLRMMIWLDEIARVPKGCRTLVSISESGHELEIRHADHVRQSAGRTVAPLTMGLIDGKGESVHILFDATIPDSGSHMVYNGKRELVEYTAVQNLFHELAHAMHMMSGTFRYTRPERQAIAEENIFRREQAALNGTLTTERFWITGVLINSEEYVAELFKAIEHPSVNTTSQ